MTKNNRMKYINQHNVFAPKKRLFIATDKDLCTLKSYKHFLEQSLYNVDRVLELFKSDDD